MPATLLVEPCSIDLPVGEAQSIPSRSRPTLSAKGRVWLALVLARSALSLAAVALAAVLYRSHPAWLLLVNPTKEAVLYGGYTVWQGKIPLVVAFAAALPLTLGGVWVAFGLGRCLDLDGLVDAPPAALRRVLAPARVAALRRSIDAHGTRVVFLARLAYFPASLSAAAAGVAGVSWRRFLLADTAGALTQLVALLLVGWRLGATYRAAGPWLTAIGVAAVVGIVAGLGRAMRRQCMEPPGA